MFRALVFTIFIFMLVSEAKELCYSYKNSSSSFLAKKVIQDSPNSTLGKSNIDEFIIKYYSDNPNLITKHRSKAPAFRHGDIRR